MNFIHIFIALGIVFTKHTMAACPDYCSCELAQQTVSCRGSNIVSFPKDIPASTEIFKLDSTNVTSIPKDAFSNLPNLKRVTITHNKKLRTLPHGLFNHTDLQELDVINLNYNSLTSLPDSLFNNLPNVRKLFLNDNGLLKLPSNILRNLPKLVELLVEKNQLTSIPADLFDDSMKQFVHTSFADNQLSSLPRDVFNPVKNTLESLYLENNQFRFLPMDAFRIIGSQFFDLNVHLNPTYCNCSLAEFVDWAKDKIHKNGVTCNGVNTPLEKINVTNCAPTTIPPSTTASTTTEQPTTTEELTTPTQKSTSTGAPYNPRITTKKQDSTTEPIVVTKQPTVAIVASETTTKTLTETATTKTSTEKVTTVPTQDSSLPQSRTQATESILKTTNGVPDPGDIETQETDENEKRKTIIIAVSVTVVVSVVLLAVIFCLLHTGILSTRRFSKNKVVIYDAEGKVLVTEKEGR